MIRFVVHPQSFPPDHPVWRQLGLHGSLQDYVFSDSAFQRALSNLMDQGSTPVVGLSEEQLGGLARLLVAPAEPDHTPAPCAICQETYGAGEETIPLNCRHQFHAECIVPWLRRVASCPICRHDPLQPPTDDKK